ncbi:hypothetical protein [Nocardioides sp. MH1]|uniref:hypothetical protein n=1 Tax=Nocardioides sp. MH1 TaxID=3242490 RepID=UPI003521B111
MNENRSIELDGFDRALLTELRLVAAEGAPAPRRTRRIALAGTGAAAVAATVVGVTTLGSPAAAYAVAETGDGDVVVTIRELEDASGLEDALADHGIDADVDYDSSDGGLTIEGPDGEAGQLPEGTDLPDGADEGHVMKGRAHVEAESGSGPSLDASGGPLGKDDPCGGPDRMPFTTDLSADAYTITIPADSVLLDQDAALQITTSGDIDDQLAGLEVAFSVGDVSCGFGTMTATAPGVG